MDFLYKIFLYLKESNYIGPIIDSGIIIFLLSLVYKKVKNNLGTTKHIISIEMPEKLKNRYFNCISELKTI